MEEKTPEEIWKELVEAAEKEWAEAAEKEWAEAAEKERAEAAEKEKSEAEKEVSEEQAKLELKKVQAYGRLLDKYIELRLDTPNMTKKVNRLTVSEKYKMSLPFYRRRVARIEKLPIRDLTSVSVTILCYRISEWENCSPGDVCKMLIALGLFSKITRVEKSIIGELRGSIGGKGNSNSEQIKEGILNGQSGHDLPGNSMGGAESPEDSSEDKYSEVQNGETIAFSEGLLGAEDTSSGKNDVDDGARLSVGNDKCEMDSVEDDVERSQLNISQHKDQDTTSDITKEDLEKFVTDFIGAMSYEIGERSPGEPSSYYELLSIHVDELSAFHKGIETWEYVQVTYFTSGMADKDRQREIERIHKLEERPRAFVIVACATDVILGHVQEKIACNSQNSIMFLCYEHPGEAHIFLKKHPKLDKMCFGFFKPDSQKYKYMHG